MLQDADLDNRMKAIEIIGLMNDQGRSDIEINVARMIDFIFLAAWQAIPKSPTLH